MLICPKNQDEVVVNRNHTPARLIEDEEFSNSVLSKAEINYYLSMKEIGLIAQETGYVGAASTTGFENTSELRPITYEEAMSGPDKEQWKLAIRKEYDIMRKYGVFKIVPNSELKEKVTFLDSKWVMKKKSNGIFRARLTARGFKQVDGEHYDSDDVSSPTININSARVLFVIMVTMWQKGLLIDVNGAFLLGNWEDDPVTHQERKIYMKVPEAFKEWINTQKFLILLLKTLYGTKNAAKRFWVYLLNILSKLGYKYN